MAMWQSKHRDCCNYLFQVNHSSTTCWYVWGILSTIFCCLPCGVIGLVHAMIAKHEGERGNHTAHRRRLYQAKCWTTWSIVLGLLVVISLFTFWVSNQILIYNVGKIGNRFKLMKKQIGLILMLMLSKKHSILINCLAVEHFHYLK